MALQIPLVALTGNDNSYFLDVTFNGNPLNLAGYTPRVYVKATQNTADGSATVYGIGTGLTYVNAALGKLKLVLPHANVTTPGTNWWRLDITDAGGNVSTALFGPLTVKAV